MAMKSELHLQVESMQSILIAEATGSRGEDKEFVYLRSQLLQSSIRDVLPDFIHTCRSLSQFWQFIKKKYTTYMQRREYIWNEFENAFRRLEDDSRNIVTTAITDSIVKFDMDYVTVEWEKAIVRKRDDPEGAITSARTLLETTCKHILDELDVDYDSEADLPKLYKITARKLNLSPDQHTEEIFKQILGGCISVVTGLGAMRNKLSDSHGTTMRQIKPSERHAALAVNLSGAMTSFILETYEYHYQKNQ